MKGSVRIQEYDDDNHDRSLDRLVIQEVDLLTLVCCTTLMLIDEHE